jgi:hypothetical protein
MALSKIEIGVIGVKLYDISGIRNEGHTYAQVDGPFSHST